MAGTWTAGIVESMAGEEPPTVEEWAPVTVPGCPARFAGESGPIAYRTRFADPRASSEDRTLVELRGAYGLTRVWLNGRYLGDHDVPFVPALFEFDAAAENELLVVCSADESTAVVGPGGALPDACTVPSVRWGVTVKRRPQTFLRAVEVDPRVTDDGASIGVRATVDAGEPVDDALTLSLRPEGFRGGGSMERARVEAAAGESTTVEKRLELRDPSLWWPHELGPQHRYTLRTKLGDDAIERTVGLRRVERDDDGFLINGERLRARGFTRLPPGPGTASAGVPGGDGAAPSDTAGSGPATDDVEAIAREDVRRAVEANATIVRARGHVPPRAFYDACDEAGLLVWQDLPAGDDVGVERASSLAETLGSTYGHHPSVATYSVETARPDPFESPLGSGRLSKLSFRWRAWRAGFDRSDADAVAETIPEDVDVVPVVGPPGTGSDAATLYPGWQYLEAADVEWLLDTYPSLQPVVAGFGAGTIAADAPETGGALAAVASTLERRDVPDGESPTYQATVLKTIAEALRRRESGVLVAETLRDPSVGGGMGVLDASGAEKPGYAALAQSYEPVQAVVDGPPKPGSVGVVVVNDTAAAVTPTVSWTAGGRGGELETSVAALGRSSAGTIDVPTDAAHLEFETVVDERTIRNRYRL